MNPAVLTALEEKLLRLALCPGVQPGEIETASQALIESWRRRKLPAKALLAQGADQRPAVQPPRQPAFSPGDVLMPFGKCRGLPLRRIRRSYLCWILETCADIQPELKRAIRAVLYE
jgi:hypothetical protein